MRAAGRVFGKGTRVMNTLGIAELYLFQFYGID
jgi:hypothetical protein